MTFSKTISIDGEKIIPIDFYRCKKSKTKLLFKDVEWLSYPVNIQRYLNTYRKKD